MATLTLAPNSTWFSQGGTSVTRASITEINIVDSYTPTGNETASWDASADKDRSVMCYVNGTKLTLAGNGSGKIYANADASWMFSDSAKKDYFTSLRQIRGAGRIDTSNSTTLARVFQMCAALESIEGLENWNTSACTTLLGTFQNCISLASVNVSTWDTSNVTAMTAMFNTGTIGVNTALKELDVSKWNTAKVTSTQQMFYGLTGLRKLDVSGWDVSRVTNMNAMFASDGTGSNPPMSLKSVGNLKNWKTTACTNMGRLFYHCGSLEQLDLSGFDTSKVTTMGDIFTKTYSLEKVTLGANFSFTGNGSTSCTLPTPASGKWYSTKTAEEFAPSALPSNVACTYVAYAPAVLAPNSTWFAPSDASVTRASITRIDIVDSYAPTGKETASWDASVSKNGGVMCYVGNGVLTMAGNGSGEIWANADSSWVFSDSAKKDYFKALTIINGAEMLDTSNATTFERMFQYATALTTFDASKWDTSNVTTTKAMFQNALELTEVDVSNWDTSNVTDMMAMFQLCTSLQSLDLSGWTNTACTDANLMFNNMVNLRRITVGSGFDFKGAVLPTPNPAYIRGADGNWYDRTGKAYAPSAIPNKTAGTYYASVAMLNGGMPLVKKHLLSRAFPRLEWFFWGCES